jgi:hypothetical protein
LCFFYFHISFIILLLSHGPAAVKLEAWRLELGAWSLELFPDPRSMLFTARLHVPYATNNMDQGSVVVLCRRTTHSSFVAIVSINRDLYYSGLYSAVTTLIPDPKGTFALATWPIGSGISSFSTVRHK